MKRNDKLIKQIEAEAHRNFESNLKFVKMHAEWLRRTSNRDWSRQQKIIIDSEYKSNRHLKLKPLI